MSIFLDHNATTPLSPLARQAMLSAIDGGWGNPGSVEHARGRSAQAQVEQARTQIANCIGASSREMIFTSGATEANNLAIIGTARFRKRHEGRNAVVVPLTEHKCVLEAARSLTSEGFEVREIPVDPSGELDWNALEAAIDNSVALVSCMLVNNETGLINKLSKISALCESFDVKVHCDAAQALGKTNLDVTALGVDLLSLSAHKAYGPMGVGALYVRRRPRARLAPLFHGGGQEAGLRSGTLPLPQIVGFAAAAQEAVTMLDAENARLQQLQTQLEQGLKSLFSDVGLKDQADQRVPHTVNASFPGMDYRTLFDHTTRGFDVSSGSACSSNDVAPSYVLTAMGLDPATARATLRIGMGRGTTAAHIDSFLDHMNQLARPA